MKTYEVACRAGIGSSEVLNRETVTARDAEEAQELVLGGLEARGWWHGEVYSVKRVA